MKRLLFTILFTLNILNVANAGTVERYFVYQTDSEVNATNLNGNFNNIVNPLNGGLNNINADTTNGFRFYEVLGVLPVAGTLGRTVFYTVDKTLNFDTGSEWYSAITLLRPPVQGDVVYYNGTNWVVLTAGTKGKSLTTGGASANPSWEGMTTQGDIEYHNGTTRTRLGYGTSGQYLQTKGAGANPVFASVPPFSNITVITTTSTWDWDADKPDKVWIKCIGGGGAGGGSSSTTTERGGGGGGGAYSEGLVTVTGDVTVTIGAGGTGVSNGTGNVGGDTSFGTDIIAKGGSGGAAGAAGAGGAGGVGASGTGTLKISGETGFTGVTSGLSGHGGHSALLYGAGALSITSAGTGNAGNVYGGGGGGAAGSGGGDQTGGAGAAGLVIVYY